MKTITCIDCDAQFSGNTPEELMQNMMPHYQNEHKDVMDAGNEEKRKVWMEEFHKRWNEAPEEK